MSCAFIDKDRIKLTVNSNLQESIVTVRDELLKQGDLYDGFVASIGSSLRESGTYWPDIEDMSRRVLNRIIGLEDDHGSN